MTRRRKPIYIETRIHGSIDEIWEKTQTPDLHQQWDVRFSRISYLPKKVGEPQLFTYATEVAPRVWIEGRGESLGDRERPDNSRWSGLKFWCDDKRSIIKKGAGYWKYIPTDDGVRFLTRFDYQPRWGFFGETIDRFIFRPIFGWATSWSFDRFRLWVEKGIDPARQRRQAIIHTLTTVVLSFVWLYHGIVPKLFTRTSELKMIEDSGFPHSASKFILYVFAVGEIAVGLSVLLFWRKRWPFVISLLAFVGLGIGAIVANPHLAGEPFSPVTLNISLIALSIIALLSDKDLPSGKNPIRKAPDEQPEVEVPE